MIQLQTSVYNSGIAMKILVLTFILETADTTIFAPMTEEWKKQSWLLPVPALALPAVSGLLVLQVRLALGESGQTLVGQCLGAVSAWRGGWGDWNLLPVPHWQG